jgi:hypothetical protein
MKYALLLLLALTLAFTAQAQSVYKFKTTNLAFRYPEDKKYRKWENCEVLVMLNWNTERLHIYSKEEQVFDLVDGTEKQTDSDGDSYITFTGVDKDGNRCQLRLLYISRSNNDELHLYVHYSDVSYVYSMHKSR